MGGALNPEEVEKKQEWEEVSNGICGIEIIFGTKELKSLPNRIA